jgi:hypothetical protein
VCELVSLSLLGTVSHYISIKFEAGTGTTHERGEKTWRSSTTRVASFSYKKRSCATVSVRHSPIISGRQSGLDLR